MISYRVIENSWIAKIAALKLGTRNVAIVIGKTIYLHNASREQFEQDKKWLKHELCHVQQFHRYGYISFIAKYLWQSMRYGYHNNKYELEARAAEKL